MAQGKTEARAVVINNMPKVTVTKTLEQVVVGGVLTADRSEIEPGVNSRYQ